MVNRVSMAARGPGAAGCRMTGLRAASRQTGLKDRRAFALPRASHKAPFRETDDVAAGDDRLEWQLQALRDLLVGTIRFCDS